MESLILYFFFWNRVHCNGIRFGKLNKDSGIFGDKFEYERIPNTGDYIIISRL